MVFLIHLFSCSYILNLELNCHEINFLGTKLKQIGKLINRLTYN